MNRSKEKQCRACSEKKILPIHENDLTRFMHRLKEGWQLVNARQLEKEFSFKDFKEALLFTNHVGQLAEQQGHHPDLHLSWGKVHVILWTHAINGLSEMDFILAEKIDQII